MSEATMRRPLATMPRARAMTSLKMTASKSVMIVFMCILYPMERGLSSVFLVFPSIAIAKMPKPMCDDLEEEPKEVV